MLFLNAGFQCYCSNVTNAVAFVVPRFEDTCDSPCDGNPSEICGGGWRLSIYRIGNFI